MKGKDKKKKTKRQEPETSYNKFSYYNEESMWCDSTSGDADHCSSPSVSTSFHHMFYSDTSASEENMYSR